MLVERTFVNEIFLPLTVAFVLFVLWAVALVNLIMLLLGKSDDES